MGGTEGSVQATSHRALEVDLKMPSQADTPSGAGR